MERMSDLQGASKSRRKQSELKGNLQLGTKDYGQYNLTVGPSRVALTQSTDSSKPDSKSAHNHLSTKSPDISRSPVVKSWGAKQYTTFARKQGRTQRPTPLGMRSEREPSFFTPRPSFKYRTYKLIPGSKITDRPPGTIFQG
jgi:hypothetical protein